MVSNCLRLILVSLTLLPAGFSRGQTVWNGGGSNDNWTTPQNWAGGIAPVSSASSYVRFQGMVRPTPFTDTNSPWVLNRIDFESRANPLRNSFQLSGNQISFQGTSPQMQIYAQALQTIDNNIEIPAGALLIEGLTIPSMTLNGLLSGSGGLTVRYANILLTASNTYEGLTTVGVSPLQASITISNGQALGSVASGTVLTLSSQLRLKGGITVAGESLSMGTGSGFYNGLVSESGNNTWTGNISLTFSAGIWSLNPGEIFTVSGNIDGGGNSLRAGGPGDLVFSGSVGNLTLYDLTKAGTGTLTLSGLGSNIYQVVVWDGTLVLSHASSLPPTTPIQLIPNAFGTSPPAEPTLRIEEDTTIGGLIAYSSDGEVSVQIGPHTLTVNQNFFSTFVGAIVGTGTFIKAGTGRIEMTGTNTYSGGTYISGGGLQFDFPQSLAGAGANVIIGAGAFAGAGYSYPIDQSFLGRISSVSQGSVALISHSANDLDFESADLNEVFLAALGAPNYGGVITPANGVYRLGGLDGTLTLTRENALSGDASIHIGVDSSQVGTVVLAGSNSVSGDVSVDGGTLAVSASTLGCKELEARAAATLQLSNGAVSGDVMIDAGGFLRGCGTINGSLTNNGSVVIDCPWGLHLNGSTINNGAMILLSGASLVTNSRFTNNGLLDLLTSTGTVLPAEFINNGTVVYPGDVRIHNLSRTGITFTMTVESFTSHYYQLQKSFTLTVPQWVSIGGPVAGSTGDDIVLTDSGATGSQAFYRIQVSP